MPRFSMDILRIIQHVEDTNDAPKPHERKMILDSIDHREVELARLRRRCDEEIDAIARERALLSPARMFSDEILKNIFLNSLPEDISAIPSTIQAPLSLCAVCQKWRKLAISIPELWSHIVIDNRRPNPTPQILQAGRWALRSKPLDYSFWLDSGPAISANREAFDLIFRSIHRCKSLNLNLFDGMKPLSITKLNDLPKLTEFTLRSTQKCDWIKPLLRASSLYLSKLEWESSVSPLLDMSFRSLRSLNLKWDLHPFRCVQMMTQCPAIETLEVSLAAVHVDLQQMAPWPYTSLTIKNLVVECQQVGDFDIFIQNLTIPSLKRLDVKHTDSDEIPWDLTSVSTMLSRSGCTPASFSFDMPGKKIIPEQLATFLAHPNVKCLRSLVLNIPDIVSFMDQLESILRSRNDVELPSKCTILPRGDSAEFASSIVLEEEIPVEAISNIALSPKSEVSHAQICDRCLPFANGTSRRVSPNYGDCIRDSKSPGRCTNCIIARRSCTWTDTPVGRDRVSSRKQKADTSSSKGARSRETDDMIDGYEEEEEAEEEREIEQSTSIPVPDPEGTMTEEPEERLVECQHANSDGWVSPCPCVRCIQTEGAEVEKVRDWRHKIQKIFLTKDRQLTPNDLPAMDGLFTTIENYNVMSVKTVFSSKIGKAMRRISELGSSVIPEDDRRYRFKARANALCERWLRDAGLREEPLVSSKKRKSEGELTRDVASEGKFKRPKP
ncbi:hypothetical protein C8J56DRAFT_1020917 [Mycena floridula]|nr:hypothetical protein C8J56DRAFT_1020917 [Mycena floridula]